MLVLGLQPQAHMISCGWIQVRVMAAGHCKLCAMPAMPCRA